MLYIFQFIKDYAFAYCFNCGYKLCSYTKFQIKIIKKFCSEYYTSFLKVFFQMNYIYNLMLKHVIILQFILNVNLFIF